MWAVLVILAAFTTLVWWTCREIRSHFAERGLEVRRVRWLPFARGGGAGSRWSMVYRVDYLDAHGTPSTCLAVPSPFHGLAIVEGASAPALPPAVAGVAAPMRARWWGFPCVSLAVAASCCLLAGVTYWTVPYGKLVLPDGLYGPGLVLAGLGAAALQFWRAARWRATLLTMTGSMVAVVAVRIAMDLMKDASRHNLLPFELAIAAFCGAAVAGAGIGAGNLLRRCLGRASR